LGLPVFAGGTGGIARFAGPTGGFLIGYFLAAATAGLVAGKPDAKTPRLRLTGATIAGFLVLYVPGIAWLRLSRNLDWPGAVKAGFVPFIIGDILKGIAAVIISPRLRRTAAGFLNGKK
jgi:biotin transport system substrate-specific component